MATQHDSPGPEGGAWYGPAPPRRMRRHRFRLPRWRVFTWFILVFNAVMLAWIVVGISSNASTCHGLTGDALTNCEAGNVGVGVGVALLFVLWALGDVILGVLWLVTRPRNRMCPACGNSVKRGVTRCGGCGYDFAQHFRPQPAGPAWRPPSTSTQAQPRRPGDAPDWRRG